MDYMFESASGIVVERATTTLDYQAGIEDLIDRLDRERGAFLSSNVEDPDRYARWDMAFAAPPLEFVGTGRTLSVNALNERGVRLLSILRPLLAPAPGRLPCLRPPAGRAWAAGSRRSSGAPACARASFPPRGTWA